MLNKVLRHTKEGLELEADPRHAEIVVKELGLTGAEASRVPGAKIPRKRELVKNGGREEMILNEEEFLRGELPATYHDEDFELDVSTVKDTEEEDEDDPDEELLEGAEATQYRAIAARLNYLAPDRMDVQHAVKEAARAMSAPRRTH